MLSSSPKAAELRNHSSRFKRSRLSLRNKLVQEFFKQSHQWQHKKHAQAVEKHVRIGNGLRGRCPGGNVNDQLRKVGQKQHAQNNGGDIEHKVKKAGPDGSPGTANGGDERIGTGAQFRTKQTAIAAVSVIRFCAASPITMPTVALELCTTTVTTAPVSIPFQVFSSE